MKKLLLLLLWVSAGLQAQIVNIPDPIFKSILVGMSTQHINGVNGPIDTNGDGEIQLTEALDISKISILNQNVSSVEGLSAFSNLTYLSITGTNIIEIDLSALMLLDYVGVSNNHIVNLDLSGHTTLDGAGFSSNPELVTVDISNTSIDDLYVYDCPNLTTMTCEGTGISETLNITNTGLQSLNLSGKYVKTVYIWNCPINNLTFSNCPDLSWIDTQYVQTQSLSISNCPDLFSIRSFGPLTAVSLTNVPHIGDIELGGSQTTELDFSHVNGGSTDLFLNLDCPQLTFLNVKNGRPDSYSAWANQITTLTHVCCDVADLPFALYNSINAIVSPYCFLTPGGNYNGLSGSVTYDIDNDGCDAQDPGQAFTALSFTSGNNQYTTFSLTDGEYLSYIVGTGTYLFQPALENPSFFTVTPPVSQLTLSGTTTSADLDFCITPNGIHHDVEVVTAPLGVIRPGFDASYAVTYRNKGNQVENGQVSFQYNDDKLDLVSTSQVPTNSAIGSLSWNFTGLLPYESRTLYVTLNANSPIETPPVNIGDIMVYNSSIMLLQPDENPNDNAVSFNQTVVGAYDPNDITCLEGNIVNTSLIGQYLYYNINFENTGNYPAENIVVNMKMDTSKFDMGSLQFLGSSHQPRIQRSSNLVEFFFEGIQLPANGKGNVLFKIKTKNTLVTGNSVSQKADIYFDFNAPVATNTATTTFQQLGMQTPTEESFVLWPNPALNLVTVSGATEIETISLFNLLGQEVARQKGNGRGAQVDVSSLPTGNYLVRVKAAGGEQLMKLVKK